MLSPARPSVFPLIAPLRRASLAGLATALLTGIAGCTTGDVAASSAALDGSAQLPLLAAAASGSAAAAPAESSGLRRRPAVDPLLAAARGRWVGTCDILGAGRDEPVFTLDIERITEPTDDPDVYTWTIIYRTADSEQVRPYLMRRDPAAAGRYLLDEGGGVVLPSYFQGGQLLVSDFALQGLRSRELFRGDRYDFEVGVSSTTPEQSTDLGGVVLDSFRVLNTQACKLRRVRR